LKIAQQFIAGKKEGRIILLNAHPALKCWATIIVSLRDDAPSALNQRSEREAGRSFANIARPVREAFSRLIACEIKSPARTISSRLIPVSKPNPRSK
jgi:hypothetical protein